MSLKIYLLLFVFIGHAVLSLLVLSAFFGIVENFYHTNKKAETKETAELVFSSMYQIMKRGWSRKDVEDFLSSLQRGESLQVKVYRGEIVEKLYGYIKQDVPDQLIKEVFEKGEDRVYAREGFIRYAYPLLAKQECLSCHTNAKQGNVLGVIEVRSDFASQLASVRLYTAIIMGLLGAFPVGGILLLGFFLGGRMKNFVDSLTENIESVARFRELEKVEKVLVEKKTGIREFDQLKESVLRLTNVFRMIAVDKEVLEFEIKILEKSLITSEFLRDWKQHVRRIVKDFSDIAPIIFMFTVFKINKELLEANVFWLGKPTEEVNSQVENLIKEEIVRKLYADKIYFVHEYMGSEIISHLEGVHLRTKSIILEKPGIGGVCGLGVCIDKASQAVELAIQSVLTSILNMVGSVKAISKYTEDIEFYATRDPLTGLYNRTVFLEMLNLELEKAKRHGHSVGIVLMDADNLHIVNEAYGHSVGDDYLKTTAKILQRITREEDAIARYEDDCFVVLVPETSFENLVSLAQRISHELNSSNVKVKEGEEVGLSYSVGVSYFPDHAHQTKDLLFVAESMVKKAKLSGKGQAAYPTEEDLNELFKEKSDINRLLLEAIEKRNIIPYFQPILNLKTGKIEAHEVLMRIKSGEEILPASAFMNVAESTGLINKMDLILIEKTMQKVAESEYKGLIFLNISPKALIYPQFIPTVSGLVKKYGVEPSRIVFELTERETIKNISLVEKFMNWLAVEGFSFAVDDFGSGFSTYQYIKRFSCDFAKVEGEFILGLDRGSQKDKAIVESIVTLCKGINIKTIAEFVESEEILRRITEL
ncbi:MAG: EAL domain-containing protein, partial [Aquificaceae bacterium]|nr:EAL domain-containing protein [Aquificaceae bacterium]